jgi:hypothetical protein
MDAVEEAVIADRNGKPPYLLGFSTENGTFTPLAKVNVEKDGSFSGHFGGYSLQTSVSKGATELTVSNLGFGNETSLWPLTMTAWDPST